MALLEFTIMVSLVLSPRCGFSGVSYAVSVLAAAV